MSPDQPPYREPARLPRPEPEPLWRERIGRVLRESRQLNGQRLVDVARSAGVSPQYLSELERGRKDASSELLEAVAGALGLQVVDLAALALAHADLLTQPGGGAPQRTAGQVVALAA